MIIGGHHSQRSVPILGGQSLIRLDLELRLVDFLKKHNFIPVYKAHPHAPKVLNDIFKGRCQVIWKPFEKTHKIADMFLFVTITSTTFSYALCMPKPIIALDLSYKGCEPFPEAMQLLKKRCRIVNTEFDERNRIIFDEKELLFALSQRPERPNNEFIEKYMFPERVKGWRV